MFFVSSHAAAAGSERYLTVLLDQLRDDWIASVAVLQDGPLVAQLRTLGIEPLIVPTATGPRALARSAYRLRRAIRARRPQLVHANGIKAALLSVAATAGTGIPVVWVKHDLSFDRSLARPLAAACRLVVGVSEAATAVFGPRLRRRVRVVPNALPPITADRQTGRAALLAALGASEPATVVTLVGRLYPMKGQHELVEAAPEICRACPSARFALIGGDDENVPEYAASLRARVAELGLQSSVSFLGHREDATSLVAGSDALVAPSVPAERGNRESFSLVALEALAVGVPVVAYAEGGLPETIGECGELVPVGDRAALRDGVLRVLRDTALRHRLADCGRRRVQERFTLERMVRSMQACYREAAKP